MRASAASLATASRRTRGSSTSLREPFERLVDTGLRLNELRSAKRLHEFLIDEATELSGAERVLLVLEATGSVAGADSLVPRGEDAQALLRAIMPCAGRGTPHSARRASRHAPTAPTALEQRSRVVAPLIAQRELLGYLYCDIDGALRPLSRLPTATCWRCSPSQAAVALDNAQWSQGLEQKVAQRTEEFERVQRELEQRANELAIINSIQQGMAAELDFQAIVDLVGDKLREVFKTGDIGIRWWDDAKADWSHFLYEYEHGRADSNRHAQCRPARALQCAKRRRPLVANTRAEQVAEGIGAPCRAPTGPIRCIGVPIIGSDRVLGLIVHGELRARARLRRGRSAPAHDRRCEHGHRRSRTRASSTRPSVC